MNDPDPTPDPDRACDRCLARPWLLARLAGHLDVARHRIEALLARSDADLIAAVGGACAADLRHELADFDPAVARDRARSAGLELICRCDRAYPAGLVALGSAPAVLHVAGGLERFLALVDQRPVAIVGARKASSYGVEVAGSLGRSLSAAGVPVLSGMALGIDCAAHRGALAGGGPTVAVLPGGANRAYPLSARRLKRQIDGSGACVAELPPDTPVRRWMFPARNRLIAALAAMIVIVEARERSGALITARIAGELGRPIGAVPGRISSPLASGPNSLLASGATLVDGAQAVLDEVFGVGQRAACGSHDRGSLAPDVVALLDAVGAGADTPEALARAGFSLQGALASLASLELAGLVRREAGGRFTPLA